jgi:metal-dependent amidase/aminoacylase/carboxypeptidase family protein
MNPVAQLPALDALRAQEAEMIEIRREIHAQPELAYEEHVTSALVAERLEGWGWEVHRGLGGTGVVGTLRHGSSRAEVDYQRRYPVVMNAADQAALCRRVVTDWCGEDGFIPNPQPVPGSDDFAFFLERVPGCYVFMGNGEGQWGDCMLHNPGYDFNDRVLSTGASLWVRLAESALPSTPTLR